MTEKGSLLKDLRILAVDDEEDILETIQEILDEAHIDTAREYQSASEKIKQERYDLAILDIMGVDGLKLLEEAVHRGIPTVMLTAYALTPEALEKSIKLGAVSFLPKEKMSDLDEFLADVVLRGGQPVWEKLFDKLGGFFNKRFGPDWKQRNQFFEDFEQSIKSEK